ncbi:hypothetical protein BKA62DRAFT_780285, partial [Auriculariales sp. MPI-PUGE-AT-0066]
MRRSPSPSPALPEPLAVPPPRTARRRLRHSSPAPAMDRSLALSGWAGTESTLPGDWSSYDQANWNGLPPTPARDPWGLPPMVLHTDSGAPHTAPVTPTPTRFQPGGTLSLPSLPPVIPSPTPSPPPTRVIPPSPHPSMPSLADEGTAHTHRTPEFTPTIQRAQADLSQYRLTVAAILASPFATNLPDEAYVHHRTPILPARTIERLNPTVAAFLIRRLVDTHKEDALKIAILQSELEVMSYSPSERCACSIALWATWFSNTGASALRHLLSQHVAEHLTNTPPLSTIIAFVTGPKRTQRAQHHDEFLAQLRSLGGSNEEIFAFLNTVNGEIVIEPRAAAPPGFPSPAASGWDAMFDFLKPPHPTMAALRSTLEALRLDIQVAPWKDGLRYLSELEDDIIHDIAVPNATRVLLNSLFADHCRAFCATSEQNVDTQQAAISFPPPMPMPANGIELDANLPLSTDYFNFDLFALDEHLLAPSPFLPLSLSLDVAMAEWTSPSNSSYGPIPRAYLWDNNNTWVTPEELHRPSVPDPPDPSGTPIFSVNHPALSPQVHLSPREFITPPPVYDSSFGTIDTSASLPGRSPHDIGMLVPTNWHAFDLALRPTSTPMQCPIRKRATPASTAPTAPTGNTNSQRAKRKNKPRPKPKPASPAAHDSRASTSSTTSTSPAVTFALDMATFRISGRSRTPRPLQLQELAVPSLSCIATSSTAPAEASSVSASASLRSISIALVPPLPSLSSHPVQPLSTPALPQPDLAELAERIRAGPHRHVERQPADMRPPALTELRIMKNNRRSSSSRERYKASRIRQLIDAAEEDKTLSLCTVPNQLESLQALLATPLICHGRFLDGNPDFASLRPAPKFSRGLLDYRLLFGDVLPPELAQLRDDWEAEANQWVEECTRLVKSWEALARNAAMMDPALKQENVRKFKDEVLPDLRASVVRDKNLPPARGIKDYMQYAVGHCFPKLLGDYELGLDRPILYCSSYTCFDSLPDAHVVDLVAGTGIWYFEGCMAYGCAPRFPATEQYDNPSQIGRYMTKLNDFEPISSTIDGGTQNHVRARPVFADSIKLAFVDAQDQVAAWQAAHDGLPHDFRTDVQASTMIAYTLLVTTGVPLSAALTTFHSFQQGLLYLLGWCNSRLFWQHALSSKRKRVCTKLEQGHTIRIVEPPVEVVGIYTSHREVFLRCAALGIPVYLLELIPFGQPPPTPLLTSHPSAPPHDGSLSDCSDAFQLYERRHDLVLQQLLGLPDGETLSWNDLDEYLPDPPAPGTLRTYPPALGNNNAHKRSRIQVVTIDCYRPTSRRLLGLSRDTHQHLAPPLALGLASLPPRPYPSLPPRPHPLLHSRNSSFTSMQSRKEAAAIPPTPVSVPQRPNLLNLRHPGLAQDIVFMPNRGFVDPDWQPEDPLVTFVRGKIEEKFDGTDTYKMIDLSRRNALMFDKYPVPKSLHQLESRSPVWHVSALSGTAKTRAHVMNVFCQWERKMAAAIPSIPFDTGGLSLATMRDLGRGYSDDIQGGWWCPESTAWMLSQLGMSFDPETVRPFTDDPTWVDRFAQHLRASSFSSSTAISSTFSTGLESILANIKMY